MPGPIDWGRIDRNLCEAYGLVPSQVDALTLPEIAVMCLPAKEEDAVGMTDAEIEAMIARGRAMSLADKLALAARRRDG